MDPVVISTSTLMSDSKGPPELVTSVRVATFSLLSASGSIIISTTDMTMVASAHGITFIHVGQYV